MTTTYSRVATQSRVVAGLASHVDPQVAKSWDRCINTFGIEPSRKRETAVVEAVELKQRQQRFGELLSVAHAEMENLYEQISGSGYAIVLTDTAGTIINCVGDPTLKTDFRRAGLLAGALWDEQHEGTNGIGTCIAEKRPVNIHRDEHFRRYNVSLSCSGAPIIGTQGELLAVLDASSVNSSDTKLIQRHTMALVGMSASLISKMHFLNCSPKLWVLRFHSRMEFVGLLNEGLLAIDGTGTVVAANQSALDQLGLSERGGLIGLPIEHVFQMEFSTLEKHAAEDASVFLSVRDAVRNLRFFMTVRGPKPQGRANASAPVTIDASEHKSSKPGSAKPAEGDAQIAAHLLTAQRLIEKGIPILVQGATGTGKEVFAKNLHRLSSRRSQAFVAVNCAAIPESLIESELFGYARGAFTDASREGRRGKVLQANGGTLFLDEIGDMPLCLQTRLLRVLEEREVIPLGGEVTIPVDVRVISATHRDIRQMIDEGRFREDLYYRLNGVTLALPLLRDRSDKLELIQALLAKESTPGHTLRISAEAQAVLINFEWPGNVRELSNVLRTAAALCKGDVIQLDDLPSYIVSPKAAPSKTMAALDAPVALHTDAPDSNPSNPLYDAERAALVHELERFRWNVTRTADVLGISRNTLYRKIRKHAIPIGQNAES